MPKSQIRGLRAVEEYYSEIHVVDDQFVDFKKEPSVASWDLVLKMDRVFRICYPLAFGLIVAISVF